MADARSGAELTDYSKVAFSADGVGQEMTIGAMDGPRSLAV